MPQVSMAIMSGLFFFYIDFYVIKDITFSGEDSIVGLIAAALMFSMQIVALPVYLKMIAKKGKTFAYRFGAYLWIVTAMVLLVIPPNVNPLYIYGLLRVVSASAPDSSRIQYGDVVMRVSDVQRTLGRANERFSKLSVTGPKHWIVLAMFVLGLHTFSTRLD